LYFGKVNNATLFSQLASNIQPRATEWLEAPIIKVQYFSIRP